MKQINRRTFLKCISAGIAGLSYAGWTTIKKTEVDESKTPFPNIIFIMADDHCKQAIGCYGGNLINTPNIDRIAKEGCIFNSMFATNSLCAPARAVLLTGKYSHKNKHLRNGQSFDGTQQTFPKLLQKAGYETAIIGKWHLRSEPTGFDYYNVMPGQGRYFDCRLKEIGKAWKDGSKDGVVRKGYLTDVLTDVSIEWLKNRTSKKPFCLMLHHKSPHSPHDPAPRHKVLFENDVIPEPPTLFDDYKGRAPEAIVDEIRFSRIVINGEHEYRGHVEKAKGMDREKAISYMYQTYIKGYLRLVVSLDENIGRLLDYLEKSGLSKNTIVIYTSDNGFFTGEHGFYNKMWMYEPSLHLPLLVRWPGVVSPETTSDELLSMIDLAPTILEIAGAPVPQSMQGQSFRPLLQGNAPASRNAIYYHYYAQYCVPELFGIRTKTHKLVHYPELEENHRWELFDLQRDPQEMHNIYYDSKSSQVAEDMKKQLLALIAKYEDDVQCRQEVHKGRQGS